MTPTRPSTRRAEILAATLRLVAHQGPGGVSMRRIAGEVGVTEGALYRHFDSKDALYREAYQQVVEEMGAQKEAILCSRAAFAARVHEWIRVSYDYFDRFPEAFTYVLLAGLEFPGSDINRRQGRLLTEMLAKAHGAGEFTGIDPVLAMSHVTGVMLNVPRLINEGTLPGPASDYTDAVARAAWAILGVADDPVGR